MNVAKKLLSVTRTIMEEEEGLITPSGDGTPDVDTKKLNAEDADNNTVTDGKGEASLDDMKYFDDVVDEYDEGPEFNDGTEFNDGKEYDDTDYDKKVDGKE